MINERGEFIRETAAPSTKEVTTKNYMVNVVTSSLKDILSGHNLISDMNQVILLQFGPCSEEEGDALADRINAWVRGGEGRGPAEAFRILGLHQKTGDVWASCDPIPTAGISELLQKFQVKTTV